MTIKEAAELLGTSPDNLRQRLATGALRATRVGGHWAVAPSEVERYRREHRRGKTLAERFWPKVARRGSDECWPWLAVKEPLGYGRFTVAGQAPKQAHRVAYELSVGPIPYGLELDHLCRNPNCVNPAHLEPVTHAENLRRARRTSCRRAGHDWTDPRNVYRSADGTATHCAECARLDRRARKDAASLAA